jgi:hypothetical protein
MGPSIWMWLRAAPVLVQSGGDIIGNLRTRSRDPSRILEPNEVVQETEPRVNKAQQTAHRPAGRPSSMGTTVRAGQVKPFGPSSPARPGPASLSLGAYSVGSSGGGRSAALVHSHCCRRDRSPTPADRRKYIRFFVDSHRTALFGRKYACSEHGERIDVKPADAHNALSFYLLLSP